MHGTSAATIWSPRSPGWAIRRALREVDQLIVATRLRAAADERATDAGTKGLGSTAEGTNFTKKQAPFAWTKFILIITRTIKNPPR